MAGLELVNQANFSGGALEAAISLYQSSWGAIMKTELEIESDEKLRGRLEIDYASRNIVFPEGQRAAIDTQTRMPVGTINSILYDSRDLPVIKNWNQLTGDGTHGTHDKYGDLLICVAIQTSERGAARLLVEAQADLARKLGKELFVFTRPNGFAAYLQDHPGVTIEQYLELLVTDKIKILGDGVSFHHHIGAVLAPLLKGNNSYLQNSRPGDASSMRYNVLMQYAL